MIQVREPAVAGYFYPATPGELSETVMAMLREEQSQTDSAPKALVVPHAGYVYSGAVAAAAYARLWSFRDHYTRVVLLGPCHRCAIRGLAISSVDAFRTPLGDVALDRELSAVLGHPSVSQSELAHRLEHSLEVQLPFLQSVLGSFSLLPLAVGEATPETVAEVIELLWGGPETLFVVSSDLSHYLAYDEACERDLETCTAIQNLDDFADDVAADGGGIGHGDACGATPLGGLLIAARTHGLKVTTLDLRNSGDTAGGKSQVVGYGAWMFQEEEICEPTAW